jgi:beta-lactamase class A
MNIITSIATVIFGVFLGWMFFSSSTEQPPGGDDASESGRSGFKSCAGQYPFLSRELDCSTINERIEQVEKIDKEIEGYANRETAAEDVAMISVFFRDLNTRRWFGVNENVNFYPASLAKLPIAMMIYKAAEVNKQILDIGLPITDAELSLNKGQHYVPSTTLESGKSYTTRELVRRMIVYSDNAPVNPLLDASASLRDPIFSDLGVYSMPTEKIPGQWDITAKNYSNLFRALYNASYLRPEYSDTILEQLSKSEFKNALAAGVPDNIRVAHKFGEATNSDEKDGEKRTILNDCGIIYKPDTPYILCVMTQGEKYEDLERIIREISEKVYRYDFSEE